MMFGSDDPGRIVERLGRPYAVEAVRMLEARQGTVAAIDAALEAAGYAMGPLRCIDQLGLDVDLALDRWFQESLGQSARFDPPELETRLAAEGRLGRESGRGFYRYESDGSVIPDVHVEVADALTDADFVERLELAVINEAYRSVEEGLASPPGVDLAMRRDAGAPAGPFERVDQLGLRHIVARLHELHAKTEERSADQYLVAASLWQIATA